jgi:hypothetical protein
MNLTEKCLEYKNYKSMLFFWNFLSEFPPSSSLNRAVFIGVVNKSLALKRQFQRLRVVFNA